MLCFCLFSEEKRNGTEQLLLTSPKSVTSIVLGKFFAAATVILITVIISIVYAIIVSFFGTVNVPTMLVTMLGFILVAMAAISIGMLISSLTENQVVVAIITIAILIAPWFLVELSNVFSAIDLMDKFMKFPYGLISISDVISLVSITVMCVLITIILIKRRKAVK